MPADLKYLSLKHAYDYVFTTAPVGAVQNDLGAVIKQFFVSSYHTLLSLSTLLYYLLLILCKIIILAFPHAVKAFRRIYHFHRTHLTTYDIIVEVILLSLIIIYFVFKERIVNTWNRFEAYVSAKSRAAARAAPHVAFFTAAFLVAVLGRKFILPLTSSSTMPIFTLMIPLATTYLRLPNLPRSDAEVKISENLKSPLILMVILGVYHATVTIGSHIPFSTRLLSVLPYVKEVVIVVLIWCQLSPVFTDIVFTSVISPALNKMQAYIPTAHLQAPATPPAASFAPLLLLKQLGVLSEAQADFLEKLLQDSVLSLLALLCVFLPSPLAEGGMVCIVFLVPCYRTIQVIQHISQRVAMHQARSRRAPPNTSSGASGSTSLFASPARALFSSPQAPAASLTPPPSASSFSPATAAATLQNDRQLLHSHDLYLHYWCCVCALWLWRIHVYRLWPSVCIALGVALQHRYLQGALYVRRYVYEHGYATLCMLQDRHQRIAAERAAASTTSAAAQRSVENPAEAAASDAIAEDVAVARLVFAERISGEEEGDGQQRGEVERGGDDHSPDGEYVDVAVAGEAEAEGLAPETPSAAAVRRRNHK
eukprot:gene37824-45949_t